MGDEPPTAERIRERHARLLARLRTVAEQNGHDPARLGIVAVTKTWPVSVVQAALDAGLTRLGESRVQEAEPKIAALPDAEWHFVGRLQSNKVRRAVRAFQVIHSIDSVELLGRVRELMAEEERRPALLVQVNVSGEPVKAGMTPETLREPETVAEVRSAGVAGLMTLAPIAAGDVQRATFRRLRELRDRLEQASGAALPELSMGMTADAEAAAAEGATLVRIGTALFGPRG